MTSSVLNVLKVCFSLTQPSLEELQKMRPFKQRMKVLVISDGQ